MHKYLWVLAVFAVFVFLVYCSRSLDKGGDPDAGVHDVGIASEPTSKIDSNIPDTDDYRYDSAVGNTKIIGRDGSAISAQNQPSDGSSYDAGIREADVGNRQIEGGEPDDISISPCPSDLTLCNDFCVDTTSNVNHCGACGNVCPVDGACIRGVCEDLCRPVDVSTTDELISRINDHDWPFDVDSKGYLRATSEIRLHASAFGNAYMFTSDVPTVMLSAETTYGIRNAYEGPNCEQYSYLVEPQVAYREATIPAGTRFGISRSGLATEDYDQSCPEGFYCLMVFMESSYACCCVDQQVDWRFIHFIEPPSECVSPLAPCDSDFAGSDHSICYQSFVDYGEAEKLIHRICVNNGNGHLFREAISCTCDCSFADIVYHQEGECAENGLCRYSGSGFCTSEKYDCML